MFILYLCFICHDLINDLLKILDALKQIEHVNLKSIELILGPSHECLIHLAWLFTCSRSASCTNLMLTDAGLQSLILST